MRITTFLEGLGDAIEAAAEERDRNGLEIIAPASIASVREMHTPASTPPRWLEIRTEDGDVFVVTVARAGAGDTATREEWAA